MKDTACIWEDNLPSGNCEIVGIGNNGVLVLKSTGFLYIRHPKKVSHFEKLSLIIEENEDITISKKIYFSRKGSTLFYQKIIRDKRPTKPSVAIFKGSSKKSDFVVQLLEYDFILHEEKVVYENNMSNHMASSFYWTVSPDFSYLLCANTSKKNKEIMDFEHWQLEKQAVNKKFSLYNNRHGSIFINDEGGILIDNYDIDNKNLLIIENDGKEYVVTGASDYKVLYFGRKKVALLVESVPFFLVRSYDNDLLYYADLKPIINLGAIYSLVIDNNSEVNFLIHKDGGLRSIRTDFDGFISNIKRLEALLMQTKIQEEKKKETIKSTVEKQQNREITIQRKAKDLEDSFKVISEERHKIISKHQNEEIKKLEKLKLEFVTGNLKPDEYVRKKDLVEKELEDDITDSYKIRKLIFEAKDLSPWEQVERVKEMKANLEKDLSEGKISKDAYYNMLAKYEDLLEVLMSIGY